MHFKDSKSFFTFLILSILQKVFVSTYMCVSIEHLYIDGIIIFRDKKYLFECIILDFKLSWAIEYFHKRLFFIYIQYYRYREEIYSLLSIMEIV